MQVGFEIEVDGRQIKVKTAVHMALGDTPAAACLGGFKEGVGWAKQKCRMCICPDHKMQICFREEQFTLLNLEQYKQDCLKLMAARNKGEFKRLSRDLGINRQSSMVRCPDFDLTKHIPMDIMHVLQEGVIMYELKCVLITFIQENVFDVKQVQEKLDAYFSQIKTEQQDKPNEITQKLLDADDRNLKQSASKMRNLIRSMPFILHDLVKDPSENSQNLLDLIQGILEITNFAFSPVISQNRLDGAIDKIEAHLKLFKDLFPQKRILPKQHYMLHIPRNIAMFGPAFRYSTSRFESEHRPHKRTILHQQNYKNVAFSVVESTQMSDSVDAESPKGCHPLFKNDLVPGRCRKVPQGEQNTFKRSLKAAYPDVEVERIMEIECTKFLTLCGEKYYAEYSFVAYGVANNMLVFGKIQHIYLVKSDERPEFTQVLLDLSMYRTIGFLPNLQAYKIEEDPLQIHTRLVTADDLIDYTSYAVIKYKRGLYISLSFEPDGLIQLTLDGHVRKHNQFSRRGRYND